MQDSQMAEHIPDHGHPGEPGGLPSSQQEHKHSKRIFPECMELTERVKSSQVRIVLKTPIAM